MYLLSTSNTLVSLPRLVLRFMTRFPGNRDEAVVAVLPPVRLIFPPSAAEVAVGSRLYLPLDMLGANGSDEVGKMM